MPAFVTSLRHPNNSADYDRVEVLLQDTLASITRQTCDDYVIIIVGNRKPSFDLPGTKVGVGLVAAREFDPEYVMQVYADDFVHRGLPRGQR